MINMKVSTHLRKIAWLTCTCCICTCFLQAQNVMTVQPGAILSSAGGGVITLTNMDLVNNGSISQQGVFIFNGGGTNTISGSSVPAFDILQINKGGGSVILQQNIQVGSALSFSSGYINLNAQNILLAPNALLTGESENGRIIGPGGGYVEISMPLNAPSLANPGNLGAVISSTQNLGTVTIRRGHQSQANGFGTGNSILRYYDITPSNNNALSATLRINYFNAELNGLDESTLTLWASPDALHWSNQGFTSRDALANYVELAAMNSFARVTLSPAANALPLLWGGFSTQCLSSQTRISWQTTQEQNTASFIIRRSSDGSSWVTIARLPAAGNSSSTLSYTYTDPLSAGSAYYQVIEQDMDGRQTVSPVLTSQCAITAGLTAYPNPAVNSVQLSVLSAGSNTITLQLFDNKGALLQQRSQSLAAGNNQFTLPLGGFTPGVYSLVVTWKDGKTKTLLLEKQ